MGITIVVVNLYSLIHQQYMDWMARPPRPIKWLSCQSHVHDVKFLLESSDYGLLLTFLFKENDISLKSSPLFLTVNVTDITDHILSFRTTWGSNLPIVPQFVVTQPLQSFFSCLRPAWESPGYNIIMSIVIWQLQRHTQRQIQRQRQRPTLASPGYNIIMSIASWL